MHFKYILFFTLAVVSKGILITGTSSDAKTVDCTQKQFKCANGRCIPEKERCDGRQQCLDGSEELNCTSCAENAFSCRDGKCVNKDSLCDLFDDCDNGSDENNCTNHVCGSDEFRCQSGQCVDKRGRCNVRVECADKSDEENCLECHESWYNPVNDSKSQKISKFKCVSSNKCIHRHELCNSIVDCPDGSDEDKDTCKDLECAEGEIQCGAGHCVRNEWICRGYNPCGDSHKAEKPNFNCTECPPYMFKCETENKCIDNRKLCDTVPDCEDESDESQSTCSVFKCGPGAFQCQSGQCVQNVYQQTLVCNGHHDCKDESDKSDEANCTTCSPEAFKCGSGECVNNLKLCNSIAECSDGSDENEINCPYGSTPPDLTARWPGIWKSRFPKYKLKHSTKDLAVYFDSSVSPSVTWPFLALSQAWEYAKETFEIEKLPEPGSQFLYVAIGKLKHDQQSYFSFRSWQSGYRNIIFPGLRQRNGWATQNSENFEKLISGLGNIVKTTKEEFLNSADYRLCDSLIQNIVVYDIYIHLKGQESADVMRWRANEFNRKLDLGKYNCFQDWFLPVYEKYGGSTVLNNYFQIFKMNWPKKQGVNKEFTGSGHDQLNVGEFVHFWSGAAGEDLRYLAKSTFHDWSDVFMRQFAKAQADFPNIAYPGEAVTISDVLLGTLICILILLFAVWAIKVSLPHIKKRYTTLIQEYW